MNKLESFLELIKEFDNSLKFEIVEIGAHPYDGIKQPFHLLLDYFQKSQIYAFEVDKSECEKLNKLCKKGMRYFPFALGEKKETRKFLVDFYKPHYQKFQKLIDKKFGWDEFN